MQQSSTDNQGFTEKQKQELVEVLAPFFTAIKQDFNNADDQFVALRQGQDEIVKTQEDIQGQLSSIQNRQSEEQASIDRHDTDISNMKVKLGVS